MEIAPVKSFPNLTAGEIGLISWQMAQGDTAVPFVLSVYADRTVQVEGTFGGASVAIEGSNDGTNYHTMTDPQGNALLFAAAGLETIMELPYYVRPAVSGGDGTTDLTITLCGRRAA